MLSCYQDVPLEELALLINSNVNTANSLLFLPSTVHQTWSMEKILSPAAGKLAQEKTSKSFAWGLKT